MAGETATRLFADPDEVKRRLEHLDDGHVKPLNDYVRRLRKRRGGGDSVPWFDPSLAGVNAQVLALHEAPGPRAVGATVELKKTGSGIISPDNNDMSAANFSILAAAAGWTRNMYISWNVVPWYLGDTSQIRAARAEDIAAALPELRAVIKLLPRLRVIVTMGRAAQIGWGMYLQREASRLVTVPCVHPSPRALNRYPDAWDRALASLRITKHVAEAAGPAS